MLLQKSHQKSNNKHQMAHTCIDIALCYYQLGKYNKSIENVRKLHLQESDGSDWLNGHLILSLINKKQGKDIDEKIIDSFIKTEKIELEGTAWTVKVIPRNGHVNPG